MTLQELYLEAKREEFGDPLCLLIEFLVLEKKVLSFADNSKELDHYFKPNNHKRMNELLIEYKKKREI